MGRTSVQDIQSTQDPQMSYNFDIIFPSIPGSGSSAARELTIKCTATTIPESQIEQVTQDNKTVRLHFAGRRVWSGTWNCTIMESRSNSTRDAIVTWQELARSLEANTGSYKSTYAVSAHLVLYDDLPQVTKRIKMVGLFPTSTGNPNLGSDSAIVSYDVTFSFDYTTEEAP